jgi:L-amino acid N-acyltransferase YncA
VQAATRLALEIRDLRPSDWPEVSTIYAEGIATETLQTSVFPENEASLRLLERHAFRVVGRGEQIGQLEGRWRDTLLLERGSEVNE